jgi:hypothetical protein
LIEDWKDFVMVIERYSYSVVYIIGWDQEKLQQTRALKNMSVDIQVSRAYYRAEPMAELSYLPSWTYALPKMLRESGRKMNYQYFYALTVMAET